VRRRHTPLVRPFGVRAEATPGVALEGATPGGVERGQRRIKLRRPGAVRAEAARAEAARLGPLA